MYAFIHLVVCSLLIPICINACIHKYIYVPEDLPIQMLEVWVVEVSPTTATLGIWDHSVGNSEGP